MTGKMKDAPAPVMSVAWALLPARAARPKAAARNLIEVITATPKERQAFARGLVPAWRGIQDFSGCNWMKSSLQSCDRHARFVTAQRKRRGCWEQSRLQSQLLAC